jgi:dienelactone hydrolase
MMMRTTTTTWLSAMALALGLGGCGDDDRAGTTPAADGGPRPMVDAFVPPGVDGFVPTPDLGPGVDGGGSTDPSSPNGMGPYAVTEESGSAGGATLVAFVPTLAGGETVPLVLFKHGFMLATSNYTTGLRQLASHGFVVVGVDGGGSTNLQEQQATIAALDWAIGSASFASSIDSSQIGVAGHSRGGKVATQVAAAESRIGATLLLDPVNGCGPGADYSADCPDVTSAAIAGSITTPIGVMGETNNATGGFMPCAPADQNYQTIYAALSAPPSWKAEWTFTGADHMDFTDDGGGFTGSFCTDGPGDDEQIRQAWRAMMVAFFRQQLKGDAAIGDWLTGGSVPSGITVVSAP